MSLLCFDTSAIIKLIRVERESLELGSWLREPSRADAVLVCSVLVLTEVPRALRRMAGGHPLPDFGSVLDGFTLRTVDEDILVAAGEYSEPTLRGLDAIHLATAQMLAEAAGGDFAALVTYDARLGNAAAALGLTVAAPTPLQ